MTENLRMYSDTTCRRAEALLDFLDFNLCDSGHGVRLEAIRQEIDSAYRRGLESATNQKLTT